MAVGVVLLGLGAWRFIEPSVPAGAITITAGDISVVDGAVCIALAFGAGFLAYFAAWPYGAEIGVLAAPAGLGLWALRSGDMTGLLRLNTMLDIQETVVRRQAGHMTRIMSLRARVGSVGRPASRGASFMLPSATMISVGFA